LLAPLTLFGLALKLKIVSASEITAGSKERPPTRQENQTLKSKDQIQLATLECQRLGIPRAVDPAKNWDGLIALSTILRRHQSHERILDAGAENYSCLLPSLEIYGFQNLTGINLGFTKNFSQGICRYEPGDITKTRFENDSWDAVACLSVIEHGVEWRAFFQEMARILRPGGTLIVSTDYFETATETQGKVAYGVPVKIFTRQEIESALKLAESFGLYLSGPLDLSCQERAVHWERMDLKFTFIIFTLIKR
jgi:SAM-dependent methyltransferase